MYNETSTASLHHFRVCACWCGIGIREPIRCLGVPPAPGHFPVAPALSCPLRRLSCFRSAISLRVVISALSSACHTPMKSHDFADLRCAVAHPTHCC